MTERLGPPCCDLWPRDARGVKSKSKGPGLQVEVGRPGTWGPESQLPSGALRPAGRTPPDRI
jgi:hypothetical protein